MFRLLGFWAWTSDGAAGGNTSQFYHPIGQAYLRIHMRTQGPTVDQ